MSSLKLLTEVIEELPELLIEDSSAGKKFFIEGRYIQGGDDSAPKDWLNGNGRYYPSHVLEKAVGAYIKEMVNEGRAYGELNHPNRPTVDFERTCIVIKELNKDGYHYNGKAQIVERSPLGQIILGIMEAGGKIGVSTRALGSLSEKNGIKFVNPDLRYTAIDVVENPSGRGCFNKMVMEGVADKEYAILEDGTIQELVREVTKKKIDEAKAIIAFSNYMKNFTRK